MSSDVKLSDDSHKTLKNMHHNAFMRLGVYCFMCDSSPCNIKVAVGVAKNVSKPIFDYFDPKLRCFYASVYCLLHNNALLHMRMMIYFGRNLRPKWEIYTIFLRAIF